jgi:tRNA (guanine37-N1)-methyltransferase
MKFDIMTLFPDMVNTVLSESILGRAAEAGHIQFRCHNIRDFSTNKHRNTDDTPYGGGMGMVMTCQPIYDCFQSIRKDFAEGERVRVIYMSPRGRVFHHEVAKELATYDRLVFLCGHYEGVDQRIIDEIVDEEISIGDYVLTGGEIPACILVDSVARLKEGVLSDPECYENESISSGLLEYPQYTRPYEFHGVTVPDVLISGHHENIDKWRQSESESLTETMRPDLYEKYKRN